VLLSIIAIEGTSLSIKTMDDGNFDANPASAHVTRMTGRFSILSIERARISRESIFRF